MQNAQHPQGSKYSSLLVTIVDGEERAAAQQVFAMAQEVDWQRIVKFALQVCCLQEQVDREVVAVLKPRDRLDSI